ncbi:hypothetical protein FOZ62_017356, partial [Perkinsus olseni]
EWWKGYSVVAIFIDIEDVLDKRSTWSALRGGVTPPWIFNAFMLTFERPISLWLTVIYADDGVMLFRYTDALSIQGSGVFGNDHKALVRPDRERKAIYGLLCLMEKEDKVVRLQHLVAKEGAESWKVLLDFLEKQDDEKLSAYFRA